MKIRIKESTYNEISHEAQYALLGNGWYTSFVTAEEYEIISNFSSGYSPYGDGTNSQPAIIAVGESWAYYMRHYQADKKYGITYSSTQNEQGIYYYNSYPVSGLSSHLNLLEDFSPYRTYDPFYWIPQGLFYDLSDNRNDQYATPPRVLIDDQVFDYTNQQMFNAFQSNIYTLQDYRVKLLQTTSNPTSSFVPNLFSQYGY